MKSFIIITAVVVAFASALPQNQEPKTHDRGCLYINGRCIEECPVGTHAYLPNFSKPWHWEPTCDNPEPEMQVTPIADYSACYCDKPTVRDSISNKCVTLDKCPKKH